MPTVITYYLRLAMPEPPHKKGRVSPTQPFTAAPLMARPAVSSSSSSSRTRADDEELRRSKGGADNVELPALLPVILSQDQFRKGNAQAVALSSEYKKCKEHVEERKQRIEKLRQV